MTLNVSAIRERLASVPVVKSGLSLMTGTMVTSGLGLVFWVLAANLYDLADFGVSTTAVYTMMMLADVACLGLRTGLVRYIPRAGARTGATILWGYGLVGAASVLTAVVFMAGLNLWAPDLIELRNSVLMLIFFVAATVFWALFTLEDAVCIGLRKSTWVPVANTVFGLLKIVLLVPFASLSPSLGIFWAWTLPVFPIVIGVNVFIGRAARNRRAHSNDLPPPATSLLRDIVTFSIADWLAAVARLAALGVIPLMVLAQLNSVEAGYFQASWLIAFTIFTLSSNAGYALLAETSYEQNMLNRNSIQAGMLSLALTLPIIVVGVLGASLLLRIYGADYAANSSTVLRILLIAALPNLIHQIYIGRLRSQGQMVGVVVLETLLSVVVVALSWFFLPRFGINGVGIAWLIGLTVLAVYAIARESLWWWAARVDTRFVRRFGAGLRRIRRGRPSRGMDGRLNEVLAATGHSGENVEWLPSAEDCQTAVVALAGQRELVVEFARSSAGATELARRHRALQELFEDQRLSDLQPLVPKILSFDTAAGEEFMATIRVTGENALSAIRHNRVPLDLVCRLALDRLRPLHEQTASTVLADEELIDRWMTEAIARLATLGRASAADVGRLRQLLIEGFAGRMIEVGQVHGELALDNIVMTTDPAAVIGFLRWERSSEMPIIIDRATLALSDLAAQGGIELGEVVRSLLNDPQPFETHPAMSNDLITMHDCRSVIMLAWLSLVGRPMSPNRTMSSEVFWLARNAQPVLASLAPNVGTRP